MAFLDFDTLNSLNFKSLGANVLISNEALILTPEKISIGDNVRIDAFSILSGEIEIGSYSHIGAHSSLSAGVDKIILGEFTGISRGVHIFANSDDFTNGYLVGPCVDDIYRNVIRGDIILKSNNNVGANSVVLPNTIFNEGASLGPLSLIINRNLKEFTYYFGNPARELMKINQERLLELKSKFLSKNTLRGGGLIYRLFAFFTRFLVPPLPYFHILFCPYLIFKRRKYGY